MGLYNWLFDGHEEEEAAAIMTAHVAGEILADADLARLLERDTGANYRDEESIENVTRHLSLLSMRGSRN